MAWKCRVCGGDLRVIVTRSFSNTYKMGEDGFPTTRPSLKDVAGEEIGRNIFCKKCDAYYEDGVDAQEVGVWKK